jgi:hypothetical protein
MNQRQHARDIFLQLHRRLQMDMPIAGVVHAGARALRRVVEDAQNSPPHGAADSTLVDPEWTKMRNIATKLEELIAAMKEAE